MLSEKLIAAYGRWLDSPARAQAIAEGWSLFYGTGSGTIEVQRLDCPEDWVEEVGFEPPALSSDAHALDNAIASARRGNPHARVAVVLVYASRVLCERQRRQREKEDRS
jgi:hypothetical protein